MLNPVVAERGVTEFVAYEEGLEKNCSRVLVSDGTIYGIELCPTAFQNRAAWFDDLYV